MVKPGIESILPVRADLQNTSCARKELKLGFYGLEIL